MVGGHSGFLRTYKWLTWDFFWVGMKNDIKGFVEKCSMCQQNKVFTLSSVGLIKTIAYSRKNMG